MTRALEEMLRVRLSRPSTGRREDDSEGEYSLHGLVHAVTATARDLPDWRDRMDLEKFAGRIARLRRPVPSRSGGGALIPA